MLPLITIFSRYLLIAKLPAGGRKISLLSKRLSLSEKVVGQPDCAWRAQPGTTGCTNCAYKSRSLTNWSVGGGGEQIGSLAGRATLHNTIINVIKSRLDNINRPDSSQHQRHQPQAPSGGQGASAAAIKQMSQRFQVHPLQSLQKRDSSFSKAATCFEAQLSLLDPELTDQRDYTLVVQNERGHQSALVRLRVATPLSPVLMISSAFVTICGLFLCSLVVMFLLKKRSNGTARSDGQSGGAANGATANGSHQANGQQLAGEKGTKDPNAMEHQQHTRGVVNGLGNGMANQASNPNGAINKQLIVDELAAGKHLLSMGASSDSSANDHKQLLGAVSSSSSTADRNCSSGSAPPSSMSSSSAATTNPCGLMDPHASYHSTGTAHSTASSSPTPMNHVSVEEEDSLALGGPPGSRHAYLTDQPSGLSGYSPEHNALIYANLDYSAPNTTSNSISTNTNSVDGAQYSPMAMQSSQQHRRQQTPMAHSPAVSNLSASIDSQSADQFQSQTGTMRPSVGATIAMMNNLAAQQQLSSSPGAGCLNGAISQQLANNRLIRKPGPPKPPKPTIQQRSRFYSQQASQSNGANSNNNGLVMIGTQQTDAYGNVLPHDPSGQPSAKELAVEYSRLAFPARAEL